MFHRIGFFLALLGCALRLGAEPALANCGIAALPQEALARLNAARAAGHTCGSQVIPPAQPLKWNPDLHSAAILHSLDMARRGYFDHRSPEGERAGQRAARSNYAWKAIGENLAGGDTNVADVMDGWLASPGHCTNMLNAVYEDVAVACIQKEGTKWGTYWTMVLGRRR